MAQRDRPETALLRALAYGGLGLAVAALVLLLQQLLLGGQLERARLTQLAGSVAFQLRLLSLGLERFDPADLAELSGLRLAVGPEPEPPPVSAGPPPPQPPRLSPQARALQQQLCRRLPHCPQVRPAGDGSGLWVEAESPLETVWLLAPWPALPGWPPGPLALVLAVSAGGLSAGLAFLWLEVQRPLQRLELALAQVDLEERPTAVPAMGARPVRHLTARFNAMLARLDASSRERSTMLAGMAHDLRSPITRLRLRLADLQTSGQDAELLRRAEADLDALERITQQMLVFAGAAPPEQPLLLPLDALLAEASGAIAADQLALDLEPLQRRVRPQALARAVANLLDNGLAHGQPPLRLQLRAAGADGFRIAVRDGGSGIPAAVWEQALQPFQRLDQARGGQGHCGLGLAIAAQVARDHGGALSWERDGDGFSVVLHGRSRPSA